MRLIATSGNVAVFAIGPMSGNRFVVDVTWETPPTQEDIREADRAWKVYGHSWRVYIRLAPVTRAWKVFSDATDIDTVPSQKADNQFEFDAIVENFLGRKEN